MNDLEVLVLLFGVAVACYYVGRYRRDYDHRSARDEMNRQWTKNHAEMMSAMNVLILKGYAERVALLFYADYRNWINGEIANDEGALARRVLQIPEPNMNELAKKEMN